MKHPDNKADSVVTRPVVTSLPVEGSDGLEQVVHRTREGHNYSLTTSKYRGLQKEALSPTRLRPLAGLIAVLAVAVLLAASHMLITGFSPPTQELATRFGFSPASFADSGLTVFTSIAVHNSLSHLLFNLAGILLFGGLLAWRIGWLAVLATFLLGGLAGAFTALPSVLVANQTAFLGADGGVYALMLSAMLLLPRPLDRDGWFPWTLLAGFFFASVATSVYGSFGYDRIYGLAPLVAGGASGILVALASVDQDDRNDFRFASVFLALALLFFLRFIRHLEGLATGTIDWALVSTWLRLLFDLFVLFVGSLYTTTQAEVVKDRARFRYQTRLDTLIQNLRKSSG